MRYLSGFFDTLISYCMRTKNKCIYVQKSPAALRAPKLRGRMKISVAREDGELVNLPIPKSCRAVVSKMTTTYKVLRYF